MNSDDPQGAWNYHERTKHSLRSVRASPHVLDWEIQPLPYKIYSSLQPIALPRVWPESRMPALDAIASPGAPPARAAIPDLAALARLLLLSAGIIRKVTYANGREMHFRAAACTGALYHIDLYLACGDLPDLTAGVYHFGVHDFALRQLRAGDHRGTIVEATGDEPALVAAPAVLLLASTFWRNAWKYQARAYRHCFWDGGTILANLLAAAAAADLPARVLLGFVDATIDRLLGLEPEREAALALVTIGYDAGSRPKPPPPVPPLMLETVPLSARTIAYPAIHAAHAASSLASASEVRAWRNRPRRGGAPSASGQGTSLRPIETPPPETIDEVIRRRGSTREFARVAITFEQLSTVLARATGEVVSDLPSPPGAHLGDLYMIVHAVDGLESGAYFCDKEGATLELLRAGDFRREAGFLGLGQELPADASVNVYLLADLHEILDRLGNRGYRAAQLDAAIMGGKFYLAAYALGLGATGLTFFDDDVTGFFSPHAAGKSVMFLVAIGRGRRRTSPPTE